MASLGTDLLTIQLLGRWGSDVVLRYVADVPPSAITQRVIEKLRTASITEVAEGEVAACGEKLAEAGVVQDQLATLQAELSRIKGQVAAAARSSETMPFVANVDSQVVHRPASCIGPTWTWRTRCGWAFARAKAPVVRPDPDASWSRCSTCFRGAEATSDEE